MSDEEKLKREVKYLASMLAAMDGMMLRVALLLAHQNGMDELLPEWNWIKGEINQEFGGVFDE